MSSELSESPSPTVSSPRPPASPAEKSLGTVTINLASLNPRLANRIVGLLNRKDSITRRRIKVKREVDLTTPDVREMLDLAEKTGLVDYCLLGFMAIGLREAEVTGSDDPRIPGERRLPGLRVEDLKRDSVLVHGKGYTVKDYDGTVRQDATKIVLYPVPGELMDPAKALARDAGHGRLVPLGTRTARRIVRRYARLAGVEEWRLVHPHRLRHWFEEAVRPVAKDPFELADMMRHSKKGVGVSSAGGFYARTISTSRRREILLEAVKPLFYGGTLTSQTLPA